MPASPIIVPTSGSLSSLQSELDGMRAFGFTICSFSIYRSSGDISYVASYTNEPFDPLNHTGEMPPQTLVSGSTAEIVAAVAAMQMKDKPSYVAYLTAVGVFPSATYAAIFEERDLTTFPVYGSPSKAAVPLVFYGTDPNLLDAIAKYVVADTDNDGGTALSIYPKVYYRPRSIFLVARPGSPRPAAGAVLWPWLNHVPWNWVVSADAQSFQEQFDAYAGTHTPDLPGHGATRPDLVAFLSVPHIHTSMQLDETGDGYARVPGKTNILPPNLPRTGGWSYEIGTNPPIQPVEETTTTTTTYTDFVFTVFVDDLVGGWRLAVDVDDIKSLTETPPGSALSPVRIAAANRGVDAAFYVVFAERSVAIQRVFRRSKLQPPTLSPTVVPPPAPEDPFAALEDAVQKQMMRSGVRSMQVAIAVRGRLVYSGAFTWAEPAPVYPDTTHQSVLYWGSFSKAICYSATLQAIEQDFEAKNNAFWIDLVQVDPSTYNDPGIEFITLGGLLTHSSGIGSADNVPEWDQLIVDPGVDGVGGNFYNYPPSFPTSLDQLTYFVKRFGSNGNDPQRIINGKYGVFEYNGYEPIMCMPIVTGSVVAEAGVYISTVQMNIFGRCLGTTNRATVPLYGHTLPPGGLTRHQFRPGISGSRSMSLPGPPSQPGNEARHKNDPNWHRPLVLNAYAMDFQLTAANGAWAMAAVDAVRFLCAMGVSAGFVEDPGGALGPKLFTNPDAAAYAFEMPGPDKPIQSVLTDKGDPSNVTLGGWFAFSANRVLDSKGGQLQVFSHNGAIAGANAIGGISKEGVAVAVAANGDPLTFLNGEPNRGISFFAEQDLGFIWNQVLTAIGPSALLALPDLFGFADSSWSK